MAEKKENNREGKENRRGDLAANKRRSGGEDDKPKGNEFKVGTVGT